MPTLAELLAFPGLGIRVLAGADRLDRQIRWVATSEYPDPTPFLQGGELLLTTGLRLGRDLDELREFAARLSQAGVVAVGFGIGLATEQVPAELLQAVGEHDLVLLEIDQPTPFIAVSKAVSDLLTAEQYADVTRGYQAQQELSRAALRGGAGSVVGTLAGVLDGWVLLLGRRGEVLHAHPPSARDTAEAVWPELGRLRTTRHAALSLVHGDEHISAHPVGTGPTASAFLVAGMPRTPLGSDRVLLALAQALLAVVDDRPGHGGAERRAAALLALVRSGAVTDPAVLTNLGATVLASSRIRVLVAAGPESSVRDWVGRVVETTDALAAVADGRGYAVIAEPGGGSGGSTGQWLVAESVAGSDTLRLGASDPVTPDQLPTALAQAEHALELARRRSEQLVHYSDLLAGPIELGDPAAAADFAARLLAPIRDGTDSADPPDPQLLDTLRVWLAHHGQLAPTAQALGVHRHTVRHRIRRLEQLLDRDLDDVDTRMELWYALRVVHNG